MYRARISPALAALACLAACGSSSADDTGDGKTDCTVTFSGAVTGTTPCNATAAYGQVVLGRSELAILNTGSPGFTLGIQQDGQLGIGTISESGAGVEVAVTTVSNGGLLWSQSTQDPVHGTVTVHLSAASLGSDGQTITIHGSVDATLPPSPSSPGATGTVTVHATF